LLKFFDNVKDGDLQRIPLDMASKLMENDDFEVVGP
jgi:hypothetical protein